MSDDATHDAVRIDFIENTGMEAQANGLPRIAGRVFGLLIYDGDAVSFGDLADQLQVSRASISTSIRILEERGLVKRLAKPGERGDFFQLAPNPYATMLEGMQKRNRAVLDDIAGTIRKLPKCADAVERLTAHANFYATKGAALAVALDELTSTEQTTQGQQPAAPKDHNDDQ